MHEDEISATDTATETAPLERKTEAVQTRPATNKMFRYIALEMRNESGKLSAEEEEELQQLRAKGMSDAQKALSMYVKGRNDFSGKSGRSEFWWSTLIVSAIGGGLGCIAEPLGWLWALGTLWPTLAVCVRRLNDIGRSWKSFFWFLVPLVGQILFLIWMTRKGNTVQMGETPSTAKVSEGSTYVSATAEGTTEHSEGTPEGTAKETLEETAEPEALPSETPETPSPEKRTYQYTEYDTPIANWISQNVVKDRDITDLFRWVIGKSKETTPTRNNQN